MAEKLVGAESTKPLIGLEELSGINDDIYVARYAINQTAEQKAIEEVETILRNCAAAGLETEVKLGEFSSLLIILRAPKALLGNSVHRSRVKDWLYGIIDDRPEGSYDTVAKAETEAESLRSMYHLVTWTKQLGGAELMPGYNHCQNVTSVFPLHNKKVNNQMLYEFSRKLILNMDDLDRIRSVYGEKVGFYFCFLQTYMVALVFPTATGIFAWTFGSGCSYFYAIITIAWCIVFLEYWRMQEINLSLRWHVRGVGNLKVDRRDYKYEKELQDPATGETIRYFPKRKRIARQLVSLPFALVALAALGAITTAIFGIELLISHVYAGEYKDWIEHLPTVILALSLPTISSYLEKVANKLTAWENHRTADRHEESLTQKVFVLNSITKFLPIFLTAFVYVPFGEGIISRLQSQMRRLLGDKSSDLLNSEFRVETSRLKSEVVALVVTEQLSSFAEELILPLVKLRARKWYNRWMGRSNTRGVDPGNSNESRLLAQARDECLRESYNVQEDIQQMVTQFGYLALFCPIWPLVPLGFLINNWIELRSDLLKISIDHQRPHPVRTDGIGAWNDSLNFLAWLGSIVSSAVMHLFHGEAQLSDIRTWWTLPITIFVAEHIYLGTRYLVRLGFERLGSEELLTKKKHEYARRKAAAQKYMHHESPDIVSENAYITADTDQKGQNSVSMKHNSSEIEDMVRYLHASASKKAA